MKKRLIVIFATLLSASTLSFAAEEKKLDAASLQKAKECLERRLKETQAQIKKEEDSLKVLRDSWNSTCTDYLSSEDKDEKGIETLFNNTYVDFDGQELYDKLEEAKKAFSKTKDAPPSRSTSDKNDGKQSEPKSTGEKPQTDEEQFDGKSKGVSSGSTNGNTRAKGKEKNKEGIENLGNH